MQKYDKLWNICYIWCRLWIQSHDCKSRFPPIHLSRIEQFIRVAYIMLKRYIIYFQGILADKCKFRNVLEGLIFDKLNGFREN